MSTGNQDDGNRRMREAYLLRLLDRLAKPSGLVERLTKSLQDVSSRLGIQTGGLGVTGPPQVKSSQPGGVATPAAPAGQKEDPATKTLAAIDAKLAKVVTNTGKFAGRMAAARRNTGGKLSAAAGGSPIFNPPSQGMGAGGPGMPQTQKDPFGALGLGKAKYYELLGALAQQNADKSKTPLNTKGTKDKEWDPEKLFGRLRTKVGGLLGPNVSGAAGEFGKGMAGGQNFEQFGANLFAGIGHMGRMIPGKAGFAVQGFAKLGEVLMKSIERLKKWTENLHASNMRFAEFSSSMAMVQAEQEMRDIRLSQERGERRADSARYLAEARSRRERAFAPIEDAFANIQNVIGGFLENVLAAVPSALTLGALPSGDQPAVGETPDPVNANVWMAAVGTDRWQENYGRPIRFQG
jgi:hypothetical protein